ncbi:hypothetical protein C0993_003246 [Termitomyces sp. T159_Od127]|nr:hypothetical protein C0993_003246 [Termitomyces sp. T159_Od127]
MKLFSKRNEGSEGWHLVLPKPDANSMYQPIHNGPEASKIPRDVAESMDFEQDEDRNSLVSRLKTILQHKEAKKQLVSCKASDAQRLLDTFQQLLDSPEIDSKFRRELIVAMQTISTKSGLHPTCYELKGVEQTSQYPVTAGGFADIYRGRFKGKAVCLKTLRLYERGHVEHALQMFSKEALLWGQLSHQNVLAIFGLFHFQNRPSIVSLWMDNGNVNDYLKKNPHAPRQRLALDVGNGLAYLHDMGIVHGDLKGPNVLVDNAGHAQLCDFGISSVMDFDLVSWTSQQATGPKAGTVRWQAPELIPIDDDGEVIRCTTASDVYAWACVSFEIFVGEVPFADIRRDAVVVHRVQSGARPKRPDSSSPVWNEWALTENIWSCMEHCWDGEPGQRPSAKEVIEYLERFHLDLKERQRTKFEVQFTGHDIPQQRIETDRLSPADFRRQMSEPIEMLTTDSLNNILGTPAIPMGKS